MDQNTPKTCFPFIILEILGPEILVARFSMKAKLL